MDKYYIVDIQEEKKDTINDYIPTSVTISYKGIHFVGVSYCHKNDIENYSYIFGGSLAEMRAIYKALVWETEVKKEYYNNLQKFCKTIMQQKNFNKEDGTAKAMFHQLNIAKKNWLKSKIEKNLTYEAITEMIVEQDKKVRYVQEIIKRKENNKTSNQD